MIARQWTVATCGKATAAGIPIVKSGHKSQHQRRVIHRSKRATEVGRERTTEIDRTKLLITQKKHPKLQEERLNRQESSKATGIGSKKEFSSKSELSLKPIVHEDTTISAPPGKANRLQIDSICTCLGIQKTSSNHPNIKHDI